MTSYQAHVTAWRCCTRCNLAHKRKRVVFARGKVPSPLLFLGESPGVSEDCDGRPFHGPAGKLLDHIIDEAVDGQVDYCIYNVVGCIPKGTGGRKLKEPPEECIKACLPRLRQFLGLCRPHTIICLGRLATRWLPDDGEYRAVSMLHPAAILRLDIAQQGLAVRRCVVTVEDVVEDLRGA